LEEFKGIWEAEGFSWYWRMLDDFLLVILTMARWVDNLLVIIKNGMK
jgi:hypothetical protein